MKEKIQIRAVATKELEEEVNSEIEENKTLSKSKASERFERLRESGEEIGCCGGDCK